MGYAECCDPFPAFQRFFRNLLGIRHLKAVRSLARKSQVAGMWQLLPGEESVVTKPSRTELRAPCPGGSSSQTEEHITNLSNLKASFLVDPIGYAGLSSC